MSVVTNVILTTSLRDKDKIARISELMEYDDIPVVVSCLAESIPQRTYGGDAEMDVNIAVGANNHLRLDQFLAALRTLEWDDPDEVQLFLLGQEDFRFTEIDWRNTPDEELVDEEGRARPMFMR